MHPRYAADALAEYSPAEHLAQNSNTHVTLPSPSTHRQPCDNERPAQPLASAAWNTHPPVAPPPLPNQSLREPRVSPPPQQSHPSPSHRQGDSTNQYPD